MVDPQALIFFGDGMQALYYDDKNRTQNRNGVWMQPILIVPSEELKKKFKLTDDDLNIKVETKRGAWMEYPIQQIEWLNKSKDGAVLFIYSDYNGNPTPHMRRYEELLEHDMQRDRTEQLLRMQVAKLTRDIENLTVNQTEMARKQKELQEAMGKRDSDYGDQAGG